MEFSLTSCTCHCKEEIKSNAKGGNGTQELFQADAQCSVNLLFFCSSVWLFQSLRLALLCSNAMIIGFLFCCGKGSSMSNSFPWMRNLINSGGETLWLSKRVVWVCLVQSVVYVLLKVNNDPWHISIQDVYFRPFICTEIFRVSPV